MVALCEAARNPEDVLLGPSPRAMLALMRCAQALAAIRGRDHVIPDDIKELAGKNTHHIIEGTFKALGRTLSKAVAINEKFKNDIPSTKGVL